MIKLGRFIQRTQQYKGLNYWVTGQHEWISDNITPSERSQTQNSIYMIPLIWNSRNGKTIVTEKRSESGDRKLTIGAWDNNAWGDKKKFCT